MEAYIDAAHIVHAPVRLLRTEVLAPTSAREESTIRTFPLKAPSRWRTVASLFISDVAALGAAMGLCSVLLSAMPPTVISVVPASFVLAFFLLSPAYAVSGLYTGIATHPAEEMRRMGLVTTGVFAVLGIAQAAQTHAWETGVLVAGAWGVTSVVVILGRVFSRLVYARASWWGYPVVVIGQGKAGIATIKTLKRWPELGYKPVALLDDDLRSGEVEGVPVCGTAEDAFALARDHKIPYAIVAMPEESRRRLMRLVGRYSKVFERLVIVPGVAGLHALWTNRRSLSGVLGYEVQHRRRKPATLFFKRVTDLLGALLGIVLLAPLFLTICVLIKVNSPGPIFYRQLRLGKGGRVFSVLKFRTMYLDAERKLTEMLRDDPELREEYETYCKLHRDPRVTRVGRFLREYSLDELPQLWNVLIGHMSLVGPRAYMPCELSKMESMEHIILQNRPGITGLWQVSGRNNLSFEERVSLAVHYTHNWNFWLDAYILVRTVPVVLTGEGAC